jgi:hypothetical protein
MKTCFKILAALSALLLFGCASKDPMDYIPEADAYMGTNSQVARNQAGMVRLSKAFQTIAKATDTSKLNRVYMAIKPASQSVSVYGVYIGMAGMSDELFAGVKSRGGTEMKIEGRKAISAKNAMPNAKSGYFIRISDSSAAFVINQEDFKTMLSTAKKKSPSALNSQAFQKLISLTGSHASAATTNASQYIGRIGPRINALAAYSPKGVEALKQLQIVSLTADWEQRPVIEATAYLNEQQAKDLAGMVQVGLQMLKMSGKGAAIASMLSNMLQVNTDTDGMKLTMNLPKDESESILSSLESGVKNLPEDPKAREQAIQMLFMSMMGQFKNFGASAGATNAPAASQQPQQYQPQQYQPQQGTSGTIPGAGATPAAGYTPSSSARIPPTPASNALPR